MDPRYHPFSAYGKLWRHLRGCRPFARFTVYAHHWQFVFVQHSMNSHSKSPLLRLPSDLLQDWSLPSVGQPPICADLSTTKSRSRELFKLPTPELRPYFRARAVVPWRPPCTRRHPASSRSLFQPVSPRSRRLVCQWSGCRDSPANLLGRHTQLIAGAGPRQPCCRHAAPDAAGQTNRPHPWSAASDHA